MLRIENTRHFGFESDKTEFIWTTSRIFASIVDVERSSLALTYNILNLWLIYIEIIKIY